MSLKPKPVDFNATWSSLRETVRGVITLDHVPRSIWNDKFSDVYSLCVAQPEPLADRLYAETKRFLIDHVAKLLVQVQSEGEANLLRNYYNSWSQYSQGVAYLHRLYLYLNQQHIKSQKPTDAEIIYGSTDCNPGGEQMEIGELALEVWKQDMIWPLGQRLVKLLLETVEADRRNQLRVSVEAAQGTILSFVQVQEYKKKAGLELYRELLEEPFLEASGEHYKREAARLLQECDVSLYMERVIAKIDEELQRTRRFLHHSSIPKVSQKCELHFVAENLQFLQSECVQMVKNERKKDLANMYPLLKSVTNGMSVLIDTFLEHVKAEGLKSVNSLSGDSVHINFVENMIEIHTRYKGLVAEIYQNDQNFMGALDKACSYVINYRGANSIRSPELLAKYCDSLLKKSSKGVSEAEIEEKLTQSITVFKYIDDKDVFQKFYSRMLAKRLIHQQSQSMDAEEQMINKLKQACGYDFTNKLHRMFTDISVSADLNESFAGFLKRENLELGVSFSIHVLQAGAWPLGSAVVSSFALPQQLERSVQMFESFYHNRFNGRKLTWLHHLCQAELRLGYLKRPYVVTVQTFQMALLLLFETSDTLSCKELRETLQLNQEQFQRHVSSLIDCKLLQIVPEAGSGDGEEEPQSAAGSSSTVSAAGPAPPTAGSSSSSAVAPSSVAHALKNDSLLRLNMDYANKRTKFRITAAVQKETTQEVEHTLNSVEEDRKLYLQAAIVRIMKSRKVLKHIALIQEVCAQSKMSFNPSIAMIKKCIEALIDKQYIERTAHSSEEYSYVA